MLVTLRSINAAVPKLDSAPVAQYRRRVGDYRILFDIDDDKHILEIVDIRARG